MAQPIGTLLIFGASGDLTNRLLLPALGQLLASDQGPDHLTVVGSGSEQWDDDTWRDHVRTAFDSVHAAGPRVDAVLAGTRYSAADVTEADDLKRLLEADVGNRSGIRDGEGGAGAGRSREGER